MKGVKGKWAYNEWWAELLFGRAKTPGNEWVRRSSRLRNHSIIHKCIHTHTILIYVFTHQNEKLSGVSIGRKLGTYIIELDCRDCVSFWIIAIMMQPPLLGTLIRKAFPGFQCLLLRNMGSHEWDACHLPAYIRFFNVQEIPSLK